MYHPVSCFLGGGPEGELHSLGTREASKTLGGR